MRTYVRTSNKQNHNRLSYRVRYAKWRLWTDKVLETKQQQQQTQGELHRQKVNQFGCCLLCTKKYQEIKQEMCIFCQM